MIPLIGHFNKVTQEIGDTGPSTGKNILFSLTVSLVPENELRKRIKNSRSASEEFVAARGHDILVCRQLVIIA